MTRSEQHTMISDLKYYSAKMSGDDLAEFQMLEKRDKDEEDLDSLASQTLQQLHLRYMPKKSLQDAEELWKKLTAKEKPGGSDQAREKF
ncbi:MAG: hypothetical protein HYW57_10705 [Ignavibacteriales bacterium]|nr:hypothetical protein [Ignavibacteriales bacterium]